MDKKATVSKWCTNPAKSKALLRKYVTVDAGEIATAIAADVWTSPCVLDTSADSFAKGIVDNGGKAFTTPC